MTPKPNLIFHAIGYDLKKQDSESLHINLEGWFGRLPMGIYRIYKSAGVTNRYRYPEEQRENLEQELYATFVVLW